MCLLLCKTKLEQWVKAFPHSLHLYGFSLLWIRWCCEVGLAVEGLPALHALVGPLPSVDHVVLEQVCALNKRFPTLRAFIRLHPRVNLFMPSKKVFLVKHFPAFVALKDIFLFLDHGIFTRST